MGCDIHVYVEKRNRDAGKWEHEKTPAFIAQKLIEGDEDFYYENDINVRRNYELFGILANVRYEQPKGGIPPRGFPGDASDWITAAYEDMDGGGHSHSYLTLEEFVLIDVQTRLNNASEAYKPQGIPTVEISNNIEIYVNSDFYKDALPEDIRIVFWFDN